MNWLNPVNWVKAGIANTADDAIDKNVTLGRGKEVMQTGLNKVIGLTESKLNDETVRKYADGFINAGEGFISLGKGIHPDGEGGRKLTLEELDDIYEKLYKAFGTLIDEEKVAAIREQLKAAVRAKLGLN